MSDFAELRILPRSLCRICNDVVPFGMTCRKCYDHERRPEMSHLYLCSRSCGTPSMDQEHGGLCSRCANELGAKMAAEDDLRRIANHEPAVASALNELFGNEPRRYARDAWYQPETFTEPVQMRHDLESATDPVLIELEKQAAAH